MPKFGKTSTANLATCNIKLQLLMNTVIGCTDCSIIAGYRDKETQDKYYKEGTSRFQYPDGKHNQKPSMAVDVIPYPFSGWDDINGFNRLVGVIQGIAHTLGIEIECGADWTWKDYPHIQLKKKKGA